MKVAKICVATIGGAFFVRSSWGAFLFYYLRSLIMDGIIVVVVVVVVWGIAMYNSISGYKRTIHVCDVQKQLNNDGFHIDKTVNSTDERFSISIDTTNQKWCFFDAETDYPQIMDYNDLLNFEIVEDGESVIQGRSGSVLVGSALLGGVGALAGASRSKKISNTCTNLSIKLIVNDVQKPLISFPLISETVKKSSECYEKSYKNATEFEAILQIILSNSNHEKRQDAFENREKDSIKEQLQELKEMLDEGLITQEDYEKKKKQILGL